MTPGGVRGVRLCPSHNLRQQPGWRLRLHRDRALQGCECDHHFDHDDDDDDFDDFDDFNYFDDFDDFE